MKHIARFVLILSLLLLPLWAAAAVNINTADADALASLKGVGPAKAQAIVIYRNEHGQFKAVEDLLQVRGIGEKTLEDNRDNITLE